MVIIHVNGQPNLAPDRTPKSFSYSVRTLIGPASPRGRAQTKDLLSDLRMGLQDARAGVRSSAMVSSIRFCRTEHLERLHLQVEEA